jgi:hypothetical protein
MHVNVHLVFQCLIKCNHKFAMFSRPCRYYGLAISGREGPDLAASGLGGFTSPNQAPHRIQAWGLHFAAWQIEGSASPRLHSCNYNHHKTLHPTTRVGRRLRGYTHRATEDKVITVRRRRRRTRSFKANHLQRQNNTRKSDAMRTARGRLRSPLRGSKHDRSHQLHLHGRAAGYLQQQQR